jgi:hypothetical protein
MEELNMKKLIIIINLIFLSLSGISKAAEPYMYGGAKLFNYGIENSDLQTINTSLIALGFTSSTTKTDNSGIGFDLGLGLNLSDNFAVEAGYVNYGTLEINTATTGPVENLTLEITGNGLTGAGVLKFGDDLENFYVKGGMHRWQLDGTVSTSLGSSSEALGNGTDLFGGAGFIVNNFYASYDYYVVDDGNFSSIGIGYRKSF